MSIDELSATLGSDHVAEVVIRRAPANFVDIAFLHLLAATLEAFDADPECRAIVLCAEGKHFCAGAQIGLSGTGLPDAPPEELYAPAVRLLRVGTPIVAAVQGAAIGAGLGLALVADFRVAALEARFVANFARLGFHHGFGLTVTLPLVVGHQRAIEMLYTGCPVDGERALAIGLADRLVPSADVRSVARSLALEIAASAPLAVKAIRATMRGDLADAVAAAAVHEGSEQITLRSTADFAEGVRAAIERRDPVFVGR